MFASTEPGRGHATVPVVIDQQEVVLGPVHVDYCGKCHGIFLDRGELDEAVVAVRAKGPKQVLAVAAKAAAQASS